MPSPFNGTGKSQRSLVNVVCGKLANRNMGNSCAWSAEMWWPDEFTSKPFWAR